MLLVRNSRRNEVDAWIRNYAAVHSPHSVQRLVDLINIYDQAILHRSLQTEQLRKFAEAAGIDGKPSELAAELLGELAEIFDSAKKCVGELFKDSKVRVRVNALVAIYSMTPTTYVLDIYSRALLDKSGRVRALAADQVMQRSLTTLLEDIDRAIDREHSEPIRQQLCRARNLLRDGTHTWVDSDGRTLLTRKAADGSLSTNTLPPS